MAENKNAKTPTDDGKPVAWITNGGKGELWWHRSSKFDEEGNLIGPNPDDIPLYTAPPKREWVGLTDEERHNIREWQEIQKELGPVWAPMMLYLYLAIEQALKEKNNG